MSSDLLKCRSKIRIGNMINSDFKIHAIRALGMVEKPTNIKPAILERHMRHSALTKRNSPGYDTVLDRSSTVGVMSAPVDEITISMYGPEVKSAAPIRSLFS